MIGRYKAVFCDREVLEIYKEDLKNPSSADPAPDSSSSSSNSPQTMLDKITSRFDGKGANTKFLQRSTAAFIFQDNEGRDIKVIAKNELEGRLGGKRRYIYTQLNINDDSYLYIMFDLTNHKLENTKFSPDIFNLQKYMALKKVQADIKKQFYEIQQENTASSSTTNTTSTAEKTYDLKYINTLFFDEEDIYFTEHQNQVIAIPTPGICHGSGGSGKTLIAIAKLLIEAQKGKNSVYYATKNPGLRIEIQQKFEETVQSLAVEAYEEMVLAEEELKKTNERRILIREKSRINDLLPQVLQEENIDINVADVLAEFEIISCNESNYLDADKTSSQFKGKEQQALRAKLFTIYQVCKQDFRDVEYIHAWIKKDLASTVGDKITSAEIFKEFIQFVGHDEKVYLDSGFDPSPFSGAEKREAREKILASFKRLQQFLADKKLMYTFFTALPVSQYSSVVVQAKQAEFDHSASSSAAKVWTYEDSVQAEDNLKNVNDRHELKDENYIKEWIKKYLPRYFKDQIKEVDLVLQEFIQFAGGDEKVYVEHGLDQSSFNGEDKKVIREKLLQLFKNLQQFLAKNKLMYAPFAALPIAKYSSLIVKQKQEELEQTYHFSAVKFCTYDELLLSSENLKNENERRTIIRDTTQISTLLEKELLDNKMTDITVEQALTEFKLISRHEETYVEKGHKDSVYNGKLKKSSRENLLKIYKRLKNDYRDVSEIKAWLEGDLKQLLKDNGLEFDLIWQEFRILCGYTKAKYLTLGHRDSNFGGQHNQALRAQLYDSYERLQKDFLAKEKLMYAPFTPLPINVCPVLIIDESQNFSLLQLKSLLQAAINNNAIFLYDRLQVLIDRMINKDAYLKLQTSYTMNECYLNENFRSREEVCKLINRLILTRNCISEDKFEGYVKCGLTDSDKGSVLFIQDNAAWQEQIILKMASPHSALITLPEFVDEAKEKYKTDRVFTVEQIQGLQYKTVINYHFLTLPDKKKITPGMEKFVAEQTKTWIEANEKLKKLKDVDLNTIAEKTTGSEDKDAKVDPRYNNVITATERAKDKVWIVEDFAAHQHKLEHVYKAVLGENKILTDVVSEEISSAVITAEEYLASAKRLVLNGNDLQAQGDYREYLQRKTQTTITEHMLKTEFAQFRSDIFSVKSNVDTDTQPANTSTPTGEDTPVQTNEMPKEEEKQENQKRKNKKRKTNKTPVVKLPAITDSSPQSASTNQFSNTTTLATQQDINTNETEEKRFINKLNELFNPENLEKAKAIEDILSIDNILEHLFESQITFNTKQGFIDHIVSDVDSKRIFSQVLQKINPKTNQPYALIFFPNLSNQSPIIREGLKKFVAHFRTELWNNTINNIQLMTRLIFDYKMIEPNALHFASALGNLEVLEYLIATGVDINAGINKLRPIHIAVGAGHLHVVKCLIEHGANVNQAGNLDGTPLYISVSSRRLDIVKYLIKHGANVNQVIVIDGEATSLCFAAQEGYLNIVRYLIQHGANVNHPINNSNPLLLAACNGRLSVVQYLLEHGGYVPTNHFIAVNTGLSALFASFPTKIWEADYFSSPIVINTGLCVVLRSEYTRLLEQKDARNASLIQCLANIVIGNMNESAEFIINKWENSDEYLAHSKSSSFQISRVQELFAEIKNKHAEILIQQQKKLSDNKLTNKTINTMKSSLTMLLRDTFTKEIIIKIKKFGNLNALFEYPIKYKDKQQCFIDHIIDDDSKHQIFLQVLQEIDPDAKQPYALIFFSDSLASQTQIVREGLIKFVAKFQTQLMEIAIKTENMQIMRSLLNYGMDAKNFAIADGTGPLLVAATKGDYRVVHFLIKSGIDVNKPRNDNATPLYQACLRGHLDIVKCLIQHDADINQEGSPYKTRPIVGAVLGGHLDIVKCLIQHGTIINLINEEGLSLLHFACQKGHLDIIKYLIKKGADINQDDKYGCTPLDTARLVKNSAVVKYLIKCGARANKEIAIAQQANESDNTISSQPTNMMIKKILMDLLSQDNLTVDKLKIVLSMTSLTALFEDQITYNNTQQCFMDHFLSDPAKNEILRNVFFQVNTKNNQPYAMMFFPVNLSNQSQEIRQGLKRMIEVHQDTFLFIAVINNRIDIVKYLIECNADINQVHRNSDKNTTLLLLATQRSLRMMKCLIKGGAKVNQEINGQAPLFHAAEKGYLDRVKYLIKMGADVNQAEQNTGITPLYTAAQNGNLRIVKCLIKNGANVNQETDDNLTPLYIAEKAGHADIVKLLKIKGAVDPLSNAQTNSSHTTVSTTTANTNDEHDSDSDEKTSGSDEEASDSEEADGETSNTQMTILNEHQVNYINMLTIALQQDNALTSLFVHPMKGAQQCPIDHMLTNHALHELFLKAIRMPNPKNNYPYALIFFPADLATQPKPIKEGLQRMVAAFQKQLYSLAVFSGCVSMIQSLLKDYKTGILNVATTANGNVNPIVIAAQCNHLNMVKFLIHNGAVIDQTGNNFTPLMCAARNGYLKIVKYLIEEKGAQVDDKLTDGTTALMWAAKYGHLNVVNYLIKEKKANIDDETIDGFTSLMKSVINNKVNTTRYLLKNHADVNKADSVGQTNLGAAAQYGQLTMTKYLLKHGADIHKAKNAGYTPLMSAAANGHTLIVERLLKHLQETILIHTKTTATTDLIRIIKHTNVKHPQLVINAAMCEALINRYMILVKQGDHCGAFIVKRLSHMIRKNLHQKNEALIKEWIQAEDNLKQNKLFSATPRFFKIPEIKIKQDEVKKFVLELAAEFNQYSKESIKHGTKM